MANKYPVYLAFQGGGAKGISHIGGLAAVNDLALEIAGVAGTSAGAIIAALVAAKCSSQAILDIATDTHILQRVANGNYADLTHLFTTDGWAKIHGLVKTKKRLKRLFSAFAKASVPWKVCAVTAFFAPGIAGLAYAPRSMFALIGILLLYAAIRLHGISKGFASLTAVRSLIDEAMSMSLKIDKKNLTFADLREHHGLPLKLVATNLTDGRLELFSFETTPDVVVADAVAASIRLPFIFKRWSISFARHNESAPTRRWFLDGGLMSNLPVWSFDEERALDRNAVTIGFGLQPLLRALPAQKHWTLAALDAIIDGPPQIHMRGIDRFIYIPLDCTLGVLDFDASLAQFKAEVFRAKEKTTLVLKQELTDIPKLMREALLRMEAVVWTEMCNTYQNGRVSVESFPRILLVVQRPGDIKSLTVAYDSDDEGPSMQYTRMSLEHSPAGNAWRQRNDNVPCFDLYLADADEAAKVRPRWTAVMPLPIVNPTPGEAADAELAVVVMMASSKRAGLQLGESSNLAAFANDLHRLMTEWLTASDFGRLARRGVSWL